MATGPGVNQGKTAFLEEFLPDNPDANLEAVNTEWTAAGNGGTISDSLVNKVRSRLGLTTRRGGGGDRTGAKPLALVPRKTRSKARAKVRKPGLTLDSASQTPPWGVDMTESSETSTGTSPVDEDILDELEEGLDELIQRIRELGGRLDVVKALKRARRLLVRGHGG